MPADLLVPGSHRASALTDDTAVVAAMLRIEAAWAETLGSVGVITSDQVQQITAATSGTYNVAELALAGEAAGNPLVPLLRELRSRIDEATAAKLVHRGLTSQDVLDTALVLISRDVLQQIINDLEGSADSLAALARRYRNSPMVGRTITQFAVPITFGLKAAQWLVGVSETLGNLKTVLSKLVVQCGGAAGTLSLLAEMVDDPLDVVNRFARSLDLVDPGLSWHTRRTQVTAIGDAVVTVTDVLGAIANNVLLLSRPEIGELREAAVTGRGGSSTMPHKQNPVLSMLIRSAAMQAPLSAAQLHLAAAQAVDERPDGAWHSEWPALRSLLLLGGTAASQAAELLRGLEVDEHTMRDRADAAAGDLLAERDGPDGQGDIVTYLGAAGDLVDRALLRHTTTRTSP